MLLFCICLCPGGGMADAEDLKSSGDFSSCGFDSHPGHHVLKYLRIEQPRESLISRQITLTLPRRSAQSQMSANPCQFRRSTQHLHEVYSPESENLKSV